MNVLLLLADLFDAEGGIQTYNRTLVWTLNELSKQHPLTLTVAVLGDTGKNPIASTYLDIRKHRYLGFQRSKSRFAAWATTHARGADLILFGHANLLPLVPLTVAGAPFARRLLWTHGVDVWDPLPPVHRRCAEALTDIASVSEYTKSRMAFVNPGLTPRWSILPCTLDPYYAHQPGPADRAGLPIPQHGKILLTVTRINRDEVKGVDRMIMAMPEILKSHPDAHYVVVGDGDAREDFQALAKRTGVEGHVHLVGRASNEDLPRYYQTCDAFVLLSTQEGFGIVFLEAMFFGKPCIGADSRAIPEVIENRATGLLVDVGSEASISQAVIGLLNRPDDRHRMGQAGRERFDARFSLPRFQSRVSALVLGAPA